MPESGAKERRPWLAWVAAAVLVAAGSVLLVRHWQHASASEYRSFASPDGEYRVVVYSIPSLLPRMPGQGGDARGYVRLYDRAGRVLRERAVDMVQSIETVEWAAARVSIKRFADWPLAQR